MSLEGTCLLARRRQTVGAAQKLVYSGGLDFGFDTTKLGKSYLNRALEINPQSVQARSLLISLRVNERNEPIYKALRNDPKESQYQTISALRESERFAVLPWLAQSAYFDGENADYYDHDMEAAKAAWGRAAKYARDALTLAPKFSGEPYHGFAIYKANMILGTLALWNGDTRTAVRHLLDASKAPDSEELAYYQGIAADRLLRRLLKNDERDPVTEFLEAMAQKSIVEKEYLLESAAALRRGLMPIWYQITRGY